jgi:leucyl aminopeptidase (aminopeptidase T)
MSPMRPNMSAGPHNRRLTVRQGARSLRPQTRENDGEDLAAGRPQRASAVRRPYACGPGGPAGKFGRVTTQPELLASAEAAVRCLGVGAADDVLVVYNDEQRVIAESLAAAANARARAVALLAFPPLSRHGEEPPADVAEAIARADVVFAPTSRSFSQTQARVDATRQGVRNATLPTITEEIFARTVAVDYAELRRKGQWLAARLTSASTARIRSAAGTDIVVTLNGRAGLSDDGHLQQRGMFGNLPAGEAYIAPLETHGDGTIVFDGSLGAYGLLATPTRVTVEDGRAVDADTDAGEWLLETLDAGGTDGRSLAELGIGTNPAAIITGNVLEDEKVIGTVHLAFGTSGGIGGVNFAGVHIDGIALCPTVELDGECVLDHGRLLVP